MLWISARTQAPSAFFQDPKERAGGAKWLIQPGWEITSSYPLPITSCSASQISKGCHPLCFLSEPSIPQAETRPFPCSQTPRRNWTVKMTSSYRRRMGITQGRQQETSGEQTNSCIGTSWWEQSSNLTKAHLLMAPRQCFLGSEPRVQPSPNRSIFPSSHQTASRCPSEHGSSSATAASANSCKMFALATSLGGFLGPGSSPSFPRSPRDEQTSTGTQTVKLEKG